MKRRRSSRDESFETSTLIKINGMQVFVWHAPGMRAESTQDTVWYLTGRTPRVVGGITLRTIELKIRYKQQAKQRGLIYYQIPNLQGLLLQVLLLQV